MKEIFIDIFLKSKQIKPDLKMVLNDGSEREINMYYYDEQIIRKQKISKITNTNTEMILTFNLNDIIFDFSHDDKIIHTQLGFLQYLFEKEEITDQDLEKLNNELKGTIFDGYKVQRGVMFNPRLILIERKWHLVDKSLNVKFKYKYEWIYIQSYYERLSAGVLYGRAKPTFKWEKR